MTPENATIIKAVETALHPFSLHAVITSGFEGIHGIASKHYLNMAVDFRIVWSKAKEPQILKSIAKSLPAGYRYIREIDHLHVEAMRDP